MERLFIDTQRVEKGQSILIIAVAFVALIGMVGLAIDGGGLLLLRRDTQNAADAAVVAAAYARCVGGDFVAAGESAAAQNGFRNSVGRVEVQVSDVTRDYDTTSNRLYVEVSITAEKTKYFIGIVYRGALTVTSKAVASCNRGFNPANYRAALFALGTDCPAGRGDINLTGANQRIYGDVIAYGDIASSGSTDGRWIDGNVLAGESNSVEPGIVTGTHAAQVDISTLSAAPIGLFQFEDYDQGSAQALAAEADGDYFYNTYPTPLHGLIFWDKPEPLNIMNSSFAGPTTIITSADLNLFNVTGNFEPYVDNIAIFSTYSTPGCNTSSGVQLSGARQSFRGIIYAPGTHVAMSAAENSAGVILARSIDISGANSVFRYDPLVLPQSEANIQIDE